MFFSEHHFQDVTQKALENGHLIPTQTKMEIFVQDGMTCLIYENIAIKRKQNNLQSLPYKKKVDPFRPFEKELHISAINGTHELVLNKFVVVKNHALLITHDFEAQTDHLTISDFKALDTAITPSKCDNWLVFYNFGMKSGASQPHKHLQIVPLIDLETREMNFPLQQVLDHMIIESRDQVKEFPFIHSFTNVSGMSLTEIHQQYEIVLKNLNLDRKGQGEIQKMIVTCPIVGKEEEHVVEYTDDDPSYNFLLTSKWMLIIPRRQENYMGISYNSIGFLNSIYVANQEQMELLKKLGIMKIYQELTFPLQWMHSK